jgi:lipoprotein LpqH
LWWRPGGVVVRPAGREQRQGSLPSGPAKLSIDDRETGDQQKESCLVTEPVATIDIGDEQSGSTCVVSAAADLRVESVSIRNLGGFTGSYNRSLGAPANVSMTGATYDLSGTADGFATDNPSFRKTGNFSIKVSC